MERITTSHPTEAVWWCFCPVCSILSTACPVLRCAAAVPPFPTSPAASPGPTGPRTCRCCKERLLHWSDSIQAIVFPFYYKWNKVGNFIIHHEPYMTYIGGDIRSETYLIFGIVKVKIWDFSSCSTARGILEGTGSLSILSLVGVKPTHRGDSLWLDATNLANPTKVTKDLFFGGI